MKKKLLNSMRVLLVSAGLCVGANAWAETTTVYSWTFTGLSADTGVTTNSGTTLTESNTSCSIATAPDNCAGLYFQGSWKCYKNATGLRNVDGGDRMVIIPSLKAGDVITINCNGTDYISSAKYTGTTNEGKTSIEYTMSAAGNFYFKLIKAGGKIDQVQVWPSLYSITVTRDVAEGSCEDPTYSITGANGNARIFTLACTTDESTIYYSTSELASATGGTEYTAAVETEATTIWAYAKTSSATSDVISFSTGAGSTLSLATPTITASGFTNSDGNCVQNPTFNFSCNNTNVIGKPTATITYTFTPDGGSESAATAGTSYAPTQYGTLKVIASAEGYAPSEKSLVVSSLYTVSYTGRDYSTANKTDISDEANWGTDYDTEGWSGWQSGLIANLLTPALSDDNHLNIQNTGTISLVNGWGFVRGDGKTYGYRVRYAKEGTFVAFKENTSKGSDATATTYQTSYCTSGSGVITDLVTITVPEWYALQQLYQYTASPLQISVTLPSSGYGSLASAYGLDFSAVDGLTAYVATSTTTEAVTLTSVDELPANQGVILKGTAGTYSIPVKADAAYEGTNLLSAAVTATDIEANTAYILQDGEFHLVTAASTVPAGKAYLLKSNVPSAARALTFAFVDNETSGIDATLTNNGIVNNEIYNLNGQRVDAPTKGLYIVNGKKVIIK